MATAKTPITDLFDDDVNLVQDFKKDWTETTRKDWVDPVYEEDEEELKPW